MPKQFMPAGINPDDFSKELSNEGWYDTVAKKNIIFFYPGSLPIEPVGNLYKFVSSARESPALHGSFNALHLTWGDDIHKGLLK